MTTRRVRQLTIAVLVLGLPLALSATLPMAAAAAAPGNVPQGTQTDAAYANSFADRG